MLLTGQDQLRNFGRFSVWTNDIQATLSKIRRYNTLKIIDGQRKGHEKKDQIDTPSTDNYLSLIHI